MQDLTSLKIYRIRSTRKISEIHSEYGRKGAFTVFLKSSIQYPVEFINEAYIRSSEYRRTRFRERMSYFICLMSGETRLERAVLRVGFSEEDHEAIVVTDSPALREELSTAGISLDTYLPVIKDSKELYGDMTLVQMELVKPDRE